MLVIRTNPWNHKTYEANTDSSDQYNQRLHNNDQLPQVVDPYVCGYCQTRFCSRNKLFYHLNFMNINTLDYNKDIDYDADTDVKAKKSTTIIKKKRKFKKWQQRRAEKTEIRYEKRRKLNDIQLTISKLLI